MVADDNRFVVIGEHDDEDNLSSSNEIYDCRTATASINNKIYVVGGEDSDGNDISYLFVLWIQQHLNRKNTAIHETNTDYCAEIALGRVMYVFGEDTAERYIGDTKQRKNLPSMSTERRDFSVHNTIYITGGVEGYGTNNLATVEVFDAEAEKWESRL